MAKVKADNLNKEEVTELISAVKEELLEAIKEHTVNKDYRQYADFFNKIEKIENNAQRYQGENKLVMITIGDLKTLKHWARKYIFVLKALNINY